MYFVVQTGERDEVPIRRAAVVPIITATAMWKLGVCLRFATVYVTEINVDNAMTTTKMTMSMMDSMHCLTSTKLFVLGVCLCPFNCIQINRKYPSDLNRHSISIVSTHTHFAIEKLFFECKSNDSM